MLILKSNIFTPTVFMNKCGQQNLCGNEAFWAYVERFTFNWNYSQNNLNSACQALVNIHGVGVIHV